LGRQYGSECVALFQDSDFGGSGAGGLKDGCHYEIGSIQHQVQANIRQEDTAVEQAEAAAGDVEKLMHDIVNNTHCHTALPCGIFPSELMIRTVRTLATRASRNIEDIRDMIILVRFCSRPRSDIVGKKRLMAAARSASGFAPQVEDAFQQYYTSGAVPSLLRTASSQDVGDGADDDPILTASLLEQLVQTVCLAEGEALAEARAAALVMGRIETVLIENELIAQASRDAEQTCCCCLELFEGDSVVQDLGCTVEGSGTAPHWLCTACSGELLGSVGRGGQVPCPLCRRPVTSPTAVVLSMLLEDPSKPQDDSGSGTPTAA
jgi:hypothetical protein